MDDDFNAPQALACLFELVALTNKNIEDKKFAISARKVLGEMLDILGISLKESVLDKVISDADVKQKITERENARINKDYKLADKIRVELDGMGVIIEDSKRGTIWRRKI